MSNFAQMSGSKRKLTLKIPTRYFQQQKKPRTIETRSKEGGVYYRKLIECTHAVYDLPSSVQAIECKEVLMKFFIDNEYTHIKEIANELTEKVKKCPGYETVQFILKESLAAHYTQLYRWSI